MQFRARKPGGVRRVCGGGLRAPARVSERRFGYKVDADREHERSFATRLVASGKCDQSLVMKLFA